MFQFAMIHQIINREIGTADQEGFLSFPETGVYSTGLIR